MANASGKPEVYTIGASARFADALASGLIERYGGDALSLARGVVLLPNQRAIAAVRDAFVRLSGDGLVLPRLVALGDDDLEAAAGGALDRLGAAEELAEGGGPATVPPMCRLALLAGLVAHERPQMLAGEAMRLAETLARLLDDLTVEHIDFAELIALAQAGDLADHWQEAFALLLSVCQKWGALRAQLNLIDTTERRNRDLAALAERWQKLGLPADYVVAAGISTSAPAVARLLRVIARANGGSVILSYLDRDMPDDQWDALGDDPRSSREKGEAARRQETHPQFHLKLLLDRMGVHRGEVADWSQSTQADGKARESVLRHLLTPARFTAEWAEVPAKERTLPGVVVLDLANPAEEAQAIALAIREALQTPAKTVALVTPDRSIAKRVAAHLARWDLAADDSAGQPLSLSPPGELLLDMASLASGDFSPVTLVALLSHPLVSGDTERRAWLDQVRVLDKALRGPRPAATLCDLSRWIERKQAANEDFINWWRGTEQALQLVCSDNPAGTTIPQWVDRLGTALSALCGDRLWAGVAGRALARWFEDVANNAADFSLLVRPHELPAILRQMLTAVTVRPPQGGHPRIKIWGLLEARLQRADRMILAGLNEGQWPPIPTPDPWLAPVVRRKLGLPSLDRRIGLAAHDFATALGGQEVIVTRAAKVDGSPTIASRLRLRMDALLGALPPTSSTIPDFAMLARQIDGAEQTRRTGRPAFRPSRDNRPQKISVTEVDRLWADPFAFYARSGLGLFRWDGLDVDPTPAWRGTAIHEVLKRWLKAGVWTDDALESLASDLLKESGVNPVVRVLWKPRLLAPLMWAAQQVRVGKEEGREPILSATEVRGAMTIGPITLSGVPDRIDRLADGRLAVVDYKTGSGPKAAAVGAGYASQLGLLGLMAEDGAFTGRAESVSRFEYWRMNKKSGQFGRVETPFPARKKDAEHTLDESNFVAFARERLSGAIALWLEGEEPFTARIKPEYTVGADYDQLMRLEEWFGHEQATDDEGVTP